MSYPTRPKGDRTTRVTTMSLDPDSYTCPDCGVICVPTHDRSAAPADVHSCS